MTTTIAARLEALGIALPEAAAPAANYLPALTCDHLLYTSGQLPFKDGNLLAQGLLGYELAVDAGREAAKWCAINVLAQAKAVLGDLEKIERIVKITVFVASTPGFTEQHLVANGASDFLAEVFGEKGRHTRSTIGVASLPLNAPVEMEAVIKF